MLFVLSVALWLLDADLFSCFVLSVVLLLFVVFIGSCLALAGLRELVALLFFYFRRVFSGFICLLSLLVDLVGCDL